MILVDPNLFQSFFHLRGVSVKLGVGVYFFLKEFCFRVRVRVDTNALLRRK